MTYNVVVGVDGSAHGDAALRWALDRGGRHAGGQVTAVFAWQLPFVSFPGAFDRAELEQAAKNFLIEKVSAVAPTPDRSAAAAGAEGDPAEVLVAASKDADLLVVGTHGRSRLAGFCSARSARAAPPPPLPGTLVKAPQDPAET